MDWKVIIALAILVTPMAYCEMDSRRSKATERVACIQAGGEWRTQWSGVGCRFSD